MWKRPLFFLMTLLLSIITIYRYISMNGIHNAGIDGYADTKTPTSIQIGVTQAIELDPVAPSQHLPHTDQDTFLPASTPYPSDVTLTSSRSEPEPPNDDNLEVMQADLIELKRQYDAGEILTNEHEYQEPLPDNPTPDELDTVKTSYPGAQTVTEVSTDTLEVMQADLIELKRQYDAGEILTNEHEYQEPLPDNPDPDHF